MQIILLEKVINLGTLGDVVRVKDGYARNFLIPQGKAKRATTANLADFEKRRAELEKAHAEVLAQAQEKATKIEGMMVQITQKAGVDGKLFGSVTNSDVSEALKKQGIDVPKAAIRMPEGPLKMIGDYPLKVSLHADVVVSITVSVLGDAS
jgi:large subunit ribosomal protein L9